MKNITKRSFFIFVLIVFFNSYFVFSSFSADNAEKTKKPAQQSMYRELELFADILSLVEEKYVEKKTPQDLIYGAAEGVLSSLDPYSQFLTPENYKELLVETEGQFGGLGIEITLKNGLLTIITPLEGTPAQRAGIQPGDIIVKINGKITKGITLNEAVKKMRGKPGTKVTITILREKTHKIKEFTITRDIIKIKDIKGAKIIKDGIGYVRLVEFREHTARDFLRALKKLKTQGMKALIIDVRNNPGGLLNSAIDISSIFLDTGKLIVFTKSRSKKEIDYKSLPLREKYTGIPIAVLINGGSASASEILASALRDHKRAILIGEKSFGKGSVQTVIPLPDGSAVRLTTAKYYTPNGNSIHEKGIVPDIVVSQAPAAPVKEKKDDIFKKLKTNKQVKKESEIDYKNDLQLLRAVNLLEGFMILSSSS